MKKKPQSQFIRLESVIS